MRYWFYFLCWMLCLDKLHSNNITYPWDKLPLVEKSIQKTSFPNNEFNVLEYGAEINKDISDAIKKAIIDCHHKGGGKVIIPHGTYYTRAIHLLSNVNFYLEEGAILKFSTVPDDYFPVVTTRWEGVDCIAQSPLIYAKGQTNVAITGKGILNGQASKENWWSKRARTSLKDKKNGKLIGKEKLEYFESNKKNIKSRIFSVKDELRPQFIQFYQCNRVLVEGITICNAPFWLLHPLLSSNIIIRGVTFNSHGPNNDGCDPESCNNVLIENCIFDTGDDCIAIKSGKNNDGRFWNIPSQNIIIRHCIMKDGHAGVAIGSEISGNCYNVWVENCSIGSPNMDRPFRIKSNAVRGGIVNGFFIRNISITECCQAVLRMELKYNKIQEGKYYPSFKNILLQNVKCKHSNYGIWIDGFENRICVSNVRLENCIFTGIQKEEINLVIGVEKLSFKNSLFNGKRYNY